MASLMLEFNKLLNNKESSWKERLKFADNAFVSPTLPIKHKEIFLLKWLLSSPDLLNNFSLIHCLKWITSPQVIDLNRTDVTAEDLADLTNSLSNFLIIANKDCDETQKILQIISTAFIENKIFQHHFKFNMELYYSFLSVYIKNINGEGLLEAALSNDQLLPKSLPVEYKTLIEGMLWSLVKAASKYPNSQSVFKATSQIITRCIFKPNIIKIISTLNGLFSNAKRVDVDIFITLFCTELETTKIEKQMYYKLLLDSFYDSTTSFPVIYKFIIVLLKNLGVRFGNIIESRPVQSINSHSEEGITILLQMFEIIGRNKNDFDCKVGDVSFNDFIKHIAEVRFKQAPCQETLQLTNIIFNMNATLIQDLTDNLIVYLMLNNFENMQNEYNNLFKLLIESYFKLHRIPGLIHKLLACPADGPSDVAVRIIQDDSFRFYNEIDGTLPKSGCYNIQSTLSPEILESLSNCLMHIVSKQTINVFMTLLNKFSDVVKDLEATMADEKNMFILEIVCAVFCQILSCVRFADNTIGDAIMAKFVNIMEKIKEGLNIFGTSVVGLKHEPRLMRAFLKTCYSWAELYIICEYYSISKNVICQKDTNFSDTSTSNITYVHNYLTSEQWCLISERITNFGETPCKQLLHKLFLQKLKAMYLFEAEINNDVFNSVKQSIVSSMRLVWNLLLTDQFAMDILLPTIDYQHKRILANCLIQDIVKNQDKGAFFKLRIANDMELNKAILSNVLQAISTLLRTKRKREDGGHKSNSTKLLNELLLNGDTLPEERIVEVFIECIGTEDSVQNNYNEGQLITYLSLLKHLPLSSCAETLQLTVFIYLCALLQDIKTVTADKDIIKQLESLILGTLQITSLPILGKMPVTALISFVCQNFIRYSEIFEQILHRFVKNEIYTNGLSSGITLLTKSAKTNQKYIPLCLITIEVIFKQINSKRISAEHKTILELYNDDIYSQLIKLMVDNKVHSIEVYAYTLGNSVTKSNSEKLELLLPLLDTYFQHAINNINDATQMSAKLSLFATVVKNQTPFKIIKAEYSTLLIWNACKNIAISEKDQDIYSKLIILIFENISNEQFESLLDDIELAIIIALRNNDDQAINGVLKRCTSILPSTFNGVKLALWTKALEQYLLKLTQYFSGKLANDAFVQFLLHLQTCAKLTLTPVMVDMNLISVQNLLHHVTTFDEFLTAFPAGYSILDSLLQHRKLVILERLPAYLQQFRHLLALLCRFSDVSKAGSEAYIDQCTEFAHCLEKLMTYIVSTAKHMSRISQYLIVEFLKQYEIITIHAPVKLHLNNCIFQLISLCDSHAVAYLMRVLSTASTGMFKLLYDTYKKYYKFKGKV